MVRSGGAAALVFLLSLFLGACASSPSPPPPGPLPEGTVRGVQPGDQVSIRFYTAAGTRQTEISGDRTVDPEGELFLPFLGTVAVAGLESAAIRRLLVQRYSSLYSDPVVEVVTNINVNITGAVRQPGQFYVPSSATIIDALARAGGVTSEIDVGITGGASDPSQVRLVRDGATTTIDVRTLAVSRDVLEFEVQSGDWIDVPRAPRSQTREQVAFWGSVFSTLLTAATLVVLIVQ